MIVVLDVVGCAEVARVLGERALGDVDPHAADVEGRVGAPALDLCAARHLVVAASAGVPAVADELLIKLVVQGTAVFIAVQGVVQPRRVQMVVGILEGEEAILCNNQRRTVTFVFGSFTSRLANFSGGPLVIPRESKLTFCNIYRTLNTLCIKCIGVFLLL